MKCKCGNELGKPRVNPFVVSFIDVKSKEQKDVLYMAGFCINDPTDPICWFCYFRSKGLR